jgi:hypothetical protein
MKNTIFILMLIAATLAVKQSGAQVRPAVFKSPMIRPSVAVKSLGIVNHHVSPPPLNRLAPGRLMFHRTPAVISNADGSTSVSTQQANSNGSFTTTTTTYNPDGTVRSTTTTTHNPDGTVTPPITDPHPTGPTPTTTDNHDGTTTTTTTLAIKKVFSDEQLPPPQTVQIGATQFLQITFVWMGSGL